MKYTKMLGLLAVAAAALTAFAGTASATELTSPKGTKVVKGTKLEATAIGANSLTGSLTLTCQKSTISGEVTSNGVSSASGSVSSLSFSECGNHTVTVNNRGSLTINDKGQVFSTGAEWTWLWHSILLGTVHCIYTTSNTDIGDLTGGTPATLDIGSKSIPRMATDSMCGEHSTLEATYTFSAPATLLVD